MNNRLQAQFQDTNIAPIARWARWSMCVMTGVFLLAFLFAPKRTYAISCLSNATLTAVTSGVPGKICGSGTATFTLTGINGGGAPTWWSANYQFQLSTDGGFSWTDIPGANGAINGPSSNIATYTTPVLTSGASCVTYWYRVHLTSIVSGCVPIGSTLTVPTTAPGYVPIDICPTAGTLTGPNTTCNGDSACYSASIAGGTFTSSNSGIFNISPTTGCGLTLGTTAFNITYTVPGGCYAIKTTTALYNAGVLGGSHYICPGSVTGLTRTGGGPSGGTWNSSNPAAATVVAGVVTAAPGAVVGDTTTITYTQTGPLGGCYATFTMTVAALPDTIVGANVPICPGSTITLTDASAPGTWSSSNSSCVSIVTGSGVATGINSGTTPCTSTITFYKSSTGCSISTIVTVNPNPTITGYPGPICTGNSYTLTGTPSGGTWASSNTAVATVDPSTGLVTGTLSTATGATAIITYTSPTGCRATQTVSINPNPTAIVTPGIVCVGASITASSSGAGGSWVIAPTTVATISPVSATVVNVTGVSQGTATVSYTLATGCRVTSVITVNPLPAVPVGPAAICVNNCVTFTDATPGGTWSSSNAAAATVGSSTGEVCGVGANTAFISYTLTSTGCSNRTLLTVNALPSVITGTLTLCIGSTTTLSSATPGGTWTSINTAVATIGASNGIVNGIDVGTSTISYVVTATGCSRSAVVTVNPPPAAITGTMLLCPGQCATLSDVTPGGTWSSSTPAVAAIGSGTGIVCGAAAGTSLISYTLTATGCRSTATVTVNSSTAPITGNTPMCVGACTSLFNSTSSGTWSSSNTAIGTVDPVTGVVCGVSAGTATISYMLPTGCMATTIVTINALPPAIGGTLTVCVGGTTSLSDVTTGGTWMSSQPTIGSIGSATGVVTGVTPGTTTITYTLPTGCSITAVVTVYAVPAAITGILTVCQGATTALSSTTPGGDWTSGNTAVATISLTTGIVTGVAPGTAVITYTTTGGCFVTAVVTVNALPAAITGATLACVGSCTTLSSTTAGGTWSSSNTTVATVGSSTGIVCGGATTGTATITYMLSTGCYVTTVVTVSTAPSAILGTLNACIGSTRTLSHATPGGTWSSSNTGVATIGSSDGVVTALTAGTTIISYILPSGCFATAIFTVNAPPAAITGSGAVCAGSTLTLSSTTPGGTWISNNTSIATVGFTTGIVTGVPPGGVTTITYTITSTGCFTTTPVTVNPSPAAITAAPSFTMCVGACNTLSNATPGGTWSSGNIAVANIGSSTGIVCGVSAGTANITYTTSSGCRAFATVTVVPLPAPITGTLLLCPGTSSSLSSTTPGGTWSIGSGGTGTALIGATTGLVTGIAAGTVVISYTVGSGCAVTAIVTINALPAPITGNFSICIGGQTTLSSTTPGGSWSSSNIIVATIGSSTGIVNGLTVGTSRITYTDLTTTCYVTQDVTVNAAPPAITGPSSVCVGSTITLADAATGGTWSSMFTTIATIGSSSGIVTGIAPGIDTITYDLSAGCFVKKAITVNLTPAAITGTSAVCIGNCITLSSTTPGGSWSSSNTAVATVGSSSGLACSVGSGTATISYVMPGTGCFVTTVVTINPLPLATTGTNVICEGDSTTLSNATAGGGVWSTGSVGIATVGSSSGVVVGTGGGVAFITFTATATGCFTIYLVTVNPLPGPINGVLEICEGSTTTMLNSTPGGVWNSSDPGIANINGSTGEVLGVMGGTVTITYTMGTGCFVTRGLTVNPLPLAIAGSLSGCVGVPTTLSDPTAGGVWSITPPGVATISATGVVIGSIPGTATVTYTLGTGCFITAIFTVNPAPEPIAGTATVCVGSCRTLTDATPGGTWSSANPLIATADPATGEVCGASAGTVTITYTAATGCYITRVFTVYPIPPAYTGTLVICQGQTTTLSDIITGGTWSSAVPTTASVGSASGIVTGVLGYGTSTITYTLPTGCFVTDVVTVNALPAPIAGDFEICAGFTTTLTDGTTGGVWSISDTSVAHIDSLTGVVTAGNTGGTTTVTYTLTATGCYVATTFIVDPLPDTIAGIKVVCVGQTSTLSNSMGSGTWISQFPAIATVGFTNGIITGITPGTSIITFTLPTGCLTTTVVTVNPLPDTIVGPSTVCVGSTITMTDATPGGTWSAVPPSVASISSSGVVTGLNAGTAIISYMLPTGCFVTKIITVNPLPGTIGGTKAMCLGNTTTLTAGTHGGTWVSADTLIVRIDSTTPSGDTIIVHGMTVGSTYITYTLPTGCYIATLVTVHALPAAIGGPSAVCAGLTITLTDATTPGTWSVTPPSVATILPTTGVLTGVAAGTATVTYTNGQGCIITKVITVNPLPTQIFGLRDVCIGSTITLHDTTVVGTWSTTDTLIIGLADSVVTGISMGDAVVTYTLTATGCIDTAQVHVHPLPNVTVNHPGILCLHASVLLSANGAGTLGEYVWTPGTSLSCDTCQETVATPTITTTYTVTGYTSFGCSDTAMVTVVVDTILKNIHITGKDSVCAGTCTQLIAEGFPPGSLFAWHPVAGLSCTICDTVIACPDATRTYFAVAIDSVGCRDSASITVHVMPLPVLDVLPRPAFVCKGDSTQLNAFSSVFGTTFAWYPNIFLTCDSCANPIAFDTMNLVYRIIGTTPFGCYDSIKVPVSVLENTINTITKDTVICKGQSVRLVANAFASDGSSSEYLWIPATYLSDNHVRNPLATPEATTTYTLVITPNVCFKDTLQVTVGVAEYPIIKITPPSANVVAGTAVPIVATIENGVLISSYAWTPVNTLSCEVCYAAVATPTVTTTYTFTATSNYGCTSDASTTISIRCDNSQVFIPNTFTPNGDGMNDRFYISAKGITSISRFSIYNRWGELVYDAHNISPNNAAQGWDGTYKGMVLAPDVFVVVVDAICELGDHFHYQADVSIVR